MNKKDEEKGRLFAVRSPKRKEEQVHCMRSQSRQLGEEVLVLEEVE